MKSVFAVSLTFTSRLIIISIVHPIRTSRVHTRLLLRYLFLSLVRARARGLECGVLAEVKEEGRVGEADEGRK